MTLLDFKWNYDIEERILDMNINVIGMGYIGLPTALMLACTGMSVVGTDKDLDKIELLKSKRHTFKEEGLEDLFEDALKNDIVFTEEYVNADVYIIAVPTPYDKRTRKVIPDYIVDAVNRIVEICKNSSIIVVESTISPGTIDKYIRPIIDRENANKGRTISIVHAPERIIPGNMIKELKANNRIIGVDDKDVGECIRSIYSRFCDGEIVLTNIRTAELAKVAENTYRDINIAYANELVKICREADVNVYELIDIANMHPRVNILSPGPGVGGHCISVDPWFLVGDYPEIANLILTSRKVNDSMPEYTLKRISKIMKENDIERLSDVGLYGLTYKENVDDIRESPTLQLISCMDSHAACGVKVYDPYIAKDIVSNQVHNLDEFLNSIKMVVIMVAHDEIIANQNKIENHVVLDTRNVTDIVSRYTL